MRTANEFEKFSGLVSHVQSVPREEIQRGEAEWRKTVDFNKSRRGPKRGSMGKPKAFAFPVPWRAAYYLEGFR